MNYLKDKIIFHTAKIGVIGLGYVGLPLSIAIAEEDFLAYGFDIDSTKIKKLSNGISYIKDVNNKKIIKLLNKEKFIPTSNFDYLENLDVIIICVPTPLNKKNKPDLSFIYNAIKELKKHNLKNKLIILESTTYPGMTNDILEKHFNNLDIGKNFFLAFSPERVDPSNKQYNVKNTAKIVGGVEENSTFLAKLFYENVLDSEIIPVSNAKTAEMCKILENTYRLLNIALIFEITNACKKLDINIWEVIKGAKTKPYGFEAFYPSPGVGGHCIPIDPLYLTWKMKKEKVKMPLIKTADQITRKMPKIISKRILKIVKNKKKKILFIGVSYKKNSSDLRESPTLKIIKNLIKKKIIIDIYDPYVKEIVINNKKYESINLKDIDNYDLVVICVDHDNIDFDYIYSHCKNIYDLKNTASQVKKKKGIIYGF